MDTRPEALLRRLLEHFYCGSDGLEWSHREGSDVGDACGHDFEAALLPYLPTSTATGLQSVIARRQARAAAVQARARPTPPIAPKVGDVVRFVMAGIDGTREGKAGQVCYGRVTDAGAGDDAWVTVLPAHRCVPGAMLAGRRHVIYRSEMLPETETPPTTTKETP